MNSPPDYISATWCARGHAI